MLSNCPYNIGKHYFLLDFCNGFINMRLTLPSAYHWLWFEKYTDVETVDSDFLTFSELDMLSVSGQKLAVFFSTGF
jgi:hypothetical protein